MTTRRGRELGLNGSGNNGRDAATQRSSLGHCTSGGRVILTVSAHWLGEEMKGEWEMFTSTLSQSALIH